MSQTTTIPSWWAPPVVDRDALDRAAAHNAKVTGRAQAVHAHPRGAPASCLPSCHLIAPNGSAAPLPQQARVSEAMRAAADRRPLWER